MTMLRSTLPCSETCRARRASEQAERGCFMGGPRIRDPGLWDVLVEGRTSMANTRRHTLEEVRVFKHVSL